MSTDRADCVLGRFLLRVLDARRKRSLGLLASAFENAQKLHRDAVTRKSSQAPPTRGSLSSMKLEKRRQLERRYSASPQRPSLAHEELVLIVPKSASAEIEPDVNSSASSDDDGLQRHRNHQHATFEVVVQHLHSQLEQARVERDAKDRRIQELEQLVELLTAETQRLHDEMTASHLELPKPAASSTAHTDSNQQHTP